MFPNGGVFKLPSDNWDDEYDYENEDYEDILNREYDSSTNLDDEDQDDNDGGLNKKARTTTEVISNTGVIQGGNKKDNEESGRYIFISPS